MSSQPTQTSAPTVPDSLDELDRAIHELSAQMNASNYRLLLLVRVFDERHGWARWGFQNAAAWLAWRCGIGPSAAREKVRTAHALRFLPAISAAFGDGRLSYAKVRALTRVAAPDNEETLLCYALEATAAQVEERSRQMRNVAPESAEEARRNWQRRSFTAWRNPEHGTIVMNVEVPVEEGELIERAIDRAIEAGETARGPEFPESSWRSQQADALVALAKTYLAGGGGSNVSSAEQYQILVHVDETALTDGRGRADLPVDAVKRLSCDGSTVRVVENARGEPLSVGRKQRTVSPAIKRALWSRDRGCSFPGCNNTRFVDAHHILHWSEGGETALDNLMLLCSHHHRLVHECGYRICRDSDGQTFFERPDGRVIPAHGDRGNAAMVREPSAEGFAALRTVGPARAAPAQAP